MIQQTEVSQSWLHMILYSVLCESRCFHPLPPPSIGWFILLQSYCMYIQLLRSWVCVNCCPPHCAGWAVQVPSVLGERTTLQVWLHDWRPCHWRWELGTPPGRYVGGRQGRVVSPGSTTLYSLLYWTTSWTRPPTATLLPLTVTLVCWEGPS